MREPFFYMIVGTLIFPFILLIVPITITWIKIGLFDTFIGLWLAFQIFAVPYSMWILRGYFAQLPRYLEEAAMVYGCTQFQAFYRVMLPLAKPVIVSVLFLAFLQGWSDFLFSNMLTTGDGAHRLGRDLRVDRGRRAHRVGAAHGHDPDHGHPAGDPLHARPASPVEDLRGGDLTTMSASNGLRVNHLRKTFRGGAVVACDDVDLEIQGGEPGPARPSAAARPRRCAASPASSAPTTRTRSGSRDATSRASRPRTATSPSCSRTPRCSRTSRCAATSRSAWT